MLCSNGLMSDVTQILSQIEAGDANAADKLLPLVYEELRKLAAARLEDEKPGQTRMALPLTTKGLTSFASTAVVETKICLIQKSREFFKLASPAWLLGMLAVCRKSLSINGVVPFGFDP
jgi:hypothetical protein